jgi:hypothetical protein
MIRAIEKALYERRAVKKQAYPIQECKVIKEVRKNFDTGDYINVG